MSETQRNFLILGIIVLLAATTSSAELGVGMLNTLVGALFVVFTAWAFLAARRRNADSIARMSLVDSIVLHASGVLFVLVLATGTVYPAWARGGTNGVLFLIALGITGFGTYYGWQRRVGW